MLPLMTPASYLSASSRTSLYDPASYWETAEHGPSTLGPDTRVRDLDGILGSCLLQSPAPAVAAFRKQQVTVTVPQPLGSHGRLH